MIVIVKNAPHITVYNPGGGLARLIGVLAEAEGLFIWKYELEE